MTIRDPEDSSIGSGDGPTRDALSDSPSLSAHLRYGEKAVSMPALRVLQDSTSRRSSPVLNTPSLSFATKQVIDGLLGNGWYDEWQQLKRDTSIERYRTQRNRKRFETIDGTGATNRLYWDMRLLESIAYDYNLVMNQIIDAKPVDQSMVGGLHDIYTLALGVVQHDNDALDAAFDIGLVAAFMIMPLAILEHRAKRLLELMTVLKTLLEQAKKERTEAWAQSLIGFALTGISIAVPQLGLLARGSLFVGQWLLDDALGPSTSKTATIGSKASLSVASLGDAISKTEDLASRTKSIAKGAGEVATVTGIAFDANEVLAGHRNVNRLKEVMDKTTEQYNGLIIAIEQNKQQILRFLEDYKQWQESIQSVRYQADLIRQALEDEIKHTGYDIKR